MRPELRHAFRLFAVTAAVLLCAGLASARQDAAPKKRLRSPAAARGFIGGESHDGYVIRARRGRTMTVQIFWRREGDNRAEFTVSESPDFSGAEPVKFGTESNGGRRWTGRIPRTRDYYIYVVGHPAAHYTLTVRVR